MATKTIRGFYGTANSCLIYIYEQRNGSCWYAVEDSTNVNCTYSTLTEGVNVEDVVDHDTFQADSPVDSEDQLEQEVDDYLDN